MTSTSQSFVNPISINSRQNSESQSSLSPYAASFRPYQLVQKNSACGTNQMDRSSSLPRHLHELSEQTVLSEASNFVDRMDISENCEKTVQQTCGFKFPPQIDQSLFRSNASVNVPSSSRDNIHSRDGRSTSTITTTTTTHVNDLIGGGKQSHVSRSRSVTRKSPGNRRKPSNSVARKKGQKSVVSNSDKQKTTANCDSQC